MKLVHTEERLHPASTREDALRIARSLESALERLVAEAPESERHSLRLAEAIAGSLVDQLEALCGAWNRQDSGIRLVLPDDQG